MSKELTNRRAHTPRSPPAFPIQLPITSPFSDSFSDSIPIFGWYIFFLSVKRRWGVGTRQEWERGDESRLLELNRNAKVSTRWLHRVIRWLQAHDQVRWLRRSLHLLQRNFDFPEALIPGQKCVKSRTHQIPIKNDLRLLRKTDRSLVHTICRRIDHVDW